MTSATTHRPGRNPRIHVAATIAVSLAFLLVVSTPASAAPGGLDTSFSGNGWVATDFGPGDDWAFDVAISPVDGTIVAVGSAGGSGGRFAVARYLPGGALDPSFGGDGKVLTNFTTGNDSAQGVALQADGKVVVAGFAAGSGGRIALARYETDGSLDDTFGGDGRVLTNLTTGDDYAWAMTVQPADQKIIVAGGAGGAGGRFALARYGTDGSLDDSFSGNGWVLTDFTSGYDYVDAVEVQDDGKILAAGATDYLRNAGRFALARYGPNGALDGSFSGDGKVTTSFSGGYGAAYGLAIQDDQRLVAVGEAGSNTALARYHPNGALDGSFGGDGRVTVNVGKLYDWADEVMIQSGGKLVIAGTWYPSKDSRVTVARFHPGGVLDGTFSGDGKVVTNLTPSGDRGIGAALQPSDGRIVVSGRTSGSGGRFVLLRYLVA